MDVSSEPLYDGDHAADRKGAQKAAKSLAATVAKLHGAAPLPAAVTQLLAATESDAFKVPEVVRILENDPGLAADLIRQVNSAGGARVKCKSIAQAVTMLGQKAVREGALAAGALEVFVGDEAPVASAIVRDARRSASVARALAPACKLDGDELYMCALLHDVGKLMMLRGDDLDYPDLLEKTPPDELHTKERELYGFDHALLGGHVLLAWKLPQPICRAVAWHHQPARAYAAKGSLPHLVALVRMTDRLARLSEDAKPADAQAAMEGMPAELQHLGLSPEQLPKLAAEVVRALREPADRDPRHSLPPPAPAEVVLVKAAAPRAPPPAPQHAPPFGAPWLAATLVAGAGLLGRASNLWLRTSLVFAIALALCAAAVAYVAAQTRAGPR